jgi:hypothetical protein
MRPVGRNFLAATRRALGSAARELRGRRDKGGPAVFHVVEFVSAFLADMEVSPKHRLEQLRIRRGMRARVQLRPHVVEGPQGPAEAADLFFEDGTVIRGISYAQFRFVDPN